MRFTSIGEIVEMAPTLNAYIYEVIEVEKVSLKVDFKKKKEIVLPKEFQKKLDEIPAWKTAPL